MTQTSTIQSTRFGVLEIADDDIVTIEDGILGFPSWSRYVVVAHKEGSPFRWLQSVDEPSLAFLVADPTHFVPSYAPEIADEAASALGLSESTPCLVYTIATIPNGKPQDMTINLAGPIVINGESRVARQLVIEHPDYAIKHRVFDSTTEKIAA